MAREEFHSRESVGPLGIGPTYAKCVIRDDDKRYEGYGENREEAEKNAREQEEADDDDE